VHRHPILGEVESIQTLGEAIRWAMARSPRPEFVDAIIQDEYTHDVVVRVDSGLFVVFDTT
jgi:hypothetical protein